jgi:hypothetical protein
MEETTGTWGINAEILKAEMEKWIVRRGLKFQFSEF